MIDADNFYGFISYILKILKRSVGHVQGATELLSFNNNPKDAEPFPGCCFSSSYLHEGISN